MYPKFHTIIVAAGTGERFGDGVPKQYLPLAGKAVVQYSIDRFKAFDNLKSLIVVIHPDHDGFLEDVQTVMGGASRQESVFNGLKAMNASTDDIILIHDAARPLIHDDDISALINEMQSAQAACLTEFVNDTLIDAVKNGRPDRSNFRALQTPQAFRYRDILSAHKDNALAQATDDTALAETAGITVSYIQSQHPNFKITTKADFTMAEALLNMEHVHPTPKIRTGTGFDVHAFENEPSERKLMLCGIEVTHDLALSGHSDADVGLHAITDALLGAAGLGDIGDHFPPSDKGYKDMDSAIFLEKAAAMLHVQSYEISNIDVTLICEAPKIGPHKNAMKNRIAEILGLAADQVNIKATTTEQLGFTGRKEGIAAQAVATLSRHCEGMK